jgi:hypothetical protein
LTPINRRTYISDWSRERLAGTVELAATFSFIGLNLKIH